MFRRSTFRKRLVCILLCFCFVIAVFVNLRPNFKKSARSEEREKRRNSAKVVEALTLLKKKDDRFLIYNRVPKCGSMSMTTLGYHLGAANRFKVASPYEDGEKPHKTEEEQLEFISFIHEQSPGYMYIRHQYFIDFSRFGHLQPLYVNMMRDPIARFQSFYFFSRFGNMRGGGGGKMNEERRNENIDECIQKRRQECVKPYWQVVPYFCGQDPGCMSRSQWAVEKAKENIEKHYAFVGILEELDDSLQLMEILIPRYFNKAKSVYKNPENEKMKLETRTRKKTDLSESAQEFLRSETSLKLEYELYDFVKNRLKLLKRELL